MAWFADWFDSAHYHTLYAHRSPDEAARFVEALVRSLRPSPGAQALDLGCGAGRHARKLAACSLQVTGLDLSAASIERARQFHRPGLAFRRHDMRAPFGSHAFDFVFNLFTSFGYFDTEAEHLGVVRNIARALRPGGTLVLDYLNVRYAESRLVREEGKVANGVAYRLTRWTTPQHFFKRIEIDEGHGREPLEYVERVARFGLADFDRMFAEAGLRLDAVFGDYSLSAFDEATSPRLILLARRPADARLSEQPRAIVRTRVQPAI
jgi:SAM-dependent methyltransferase